MLCGVRFIHTHHLQKNVMKKQSKHENTVCIQKTVHNAVKPQKNPSISAGGLVV